MGANAVADEMLSECADTGQSARRVDSDTEAEALRRELRRSARAAGLRIRTARLGDTVVVARTDAQLWNDDTATMRAKLTPPT